MSENLIQPSFTAGELAAAAHGRVDVQKYHEGLAIAENFFVHAHGGVSNRAGLYYIGNSQDHTVVHCLLPFIFSSSQSYVLMFGDQVMRVIKDGGMVLETAVNITGATAANPVVVTSAGHGYANGDEVYISGVEGMTELNGRFFTVANQTANTFELSSIDGLAYTAYSTGGTAEKVYEISTPYLEADLFDLKYSQSADVMTLTHPDYQDRELSRSGHTNWALNTITLATAVSTPANLVATTTAGGAAEVDYKYKVTATDVSGDESLASSPATTSAKIARAWPSGCQVDLSWDTVTGADYYTVYKQYRSKGSYGYIGTTDTNSFVDDNIIPDTSETPPVSNNDPFGVDSSGDCPGCVGYHQQRRAFARTDNAPQAIWLSQTGLYSNFNKSAPLRGTDYIQVTLSTSEEIRHLIELKKMIVLTSGGAHLIVGDGDNNSISPSTIRSEQVGYIGASNVRPLVIGNTILFIEDLGSGVQDIAYSFASDGYEGNDLAILANHMFEGHTIVQWAYARKPFSIVWAVRDDGVLLGLTYLKEHKVWAWHRHLTDGYVESVCVVPESDEHAVYVMVKRYVDGGWKRFSERMHTRHFTDIKDAFFVDCGLSYDNPVAITGITSANPVVVTTGTAHGYAVNDYVDFSDIVTLADDGSSDMNGMRYVVTSKTSTTLTLETLDGDPLDGSAFDTYDSGGYVRKAIQTLTGLNHLEGESVVALADGSVVSDLTVSGGAVTLSFKASRIHLGLPYTGTIKTLRPEPSAGSVQGRKQSLVGVTVHFKDTRGGYIGKDLDSLYEVKQRSDEDWDQPTGMTTGYYKMQVLGNWGTDASFYLQQPDPLPMTVVGLVPELEFGL